MDIWINKEARTHTQTAFEAKSTNGKSVRKIQKANERTNTNDVRREKITGGARFVQYLFVCRCRILCWFHAQVIASLRSKLKFMQQTRMCVCVRSQTCARQCHLFQSSTSCFFCVCVIQFYQSRNWNWHSFKWSPLTLTDTAALRLKSSPKSE